MAQITFTVNDAFVARIVVAFRAQFPTLTAGLTDAQAIKAVMIQLVKGVMSDFEAQQAIVPAQTQMQTLTTQFQSTFATQHAQTQTDVGVNIT